MLCPKCGVAISGTPGETERVLGQDRTTFYCFNDKCSVWGFILITDVNEFKEIREG